jgi:hypothetical protein
MARRARIHRRARTGRRPRAERGAASSPLDPAFRARRDQRRPREWAAGRPGMALRRHRGDAPLLTDEGPSGRQQCDGAERGFRPPRTALPGDDQPVSGVHRPNRAYHGGPRAELQYERTPGRKNDIAREAVGRTRPRTQQSGVRDGTGRQTAPRGARRGGRGVAGARRRRVDPRTGGGDRTNADRLPGKTRRP